MRSFRFIGLSVIIALMAVCARGIYQCSCEEKEFPDEGRRRDGEHIHLCCLCVYVEGRTILYVGGLKAEAGSVVKPWLGNAAGAV